jgi:hypothetical protein
VTIRSSRYFSSVQCLEPTMIHDTCRQYARKTFHSFASCGTCLCMALSSIYTCILLPWTCIQLLRHDPSPRVNDWYFIAWRFMFPLSTLLFIMLVSGIGHLFGVVAYILTAGSVWFYCQFIVIAMPFVLVYRYPNLSARLRSLFWKVLAACSVLTSAIECFVLTEGMAAYHSSSSPHKINTHGGEQRKLGWLMGNTMFGIVGLVGIPYFFIQQSRIIRMTETDATLIASSSTTHGLSTASDSPMIHLVPPAAVPDGDNNAILRSTRTSTRSSYETH